MNVLVVGTVFDDAVHSSAASDASTAVRAVAVNLPSAATAERNVLASLRRYPLLRKRYVDPTTGLTAPGVVTNCDPHTAHVLEPWILDCVATRAVQGAKLQTPLEYHALPNGRFRITVLG